MKKKSSLFFVGREGAPSAENAPALSIGEVLFGAVRLKLKKAATGSCVKGFQRAQCAEIGWYRERSGSPHVLCMGRAFFMLTVRYKTEIIYERIY